MIANYDLAFEAEPTDAPPLDTEELVERANVANQAVASVPIEYNGETAVAEAQDAAVIEGQ